MWWCPFFLTLMFRSLRCCRDFTTMMLATTIMTSIRVMRITLPIEDAIGTTRRLLLKKVPWSFWSCRVEVVNLISWGALDEFKSEEDIDTVVVRVSSSVEVIGEVLELLSWGVVKSKEGLDTVVVRVSSSVEVAGESVVVDTLCGTWVIGAAESNTHDHFQDEFKPTTT